MHRSECRVRCRPRGASRTAFCAQADALRIAHKQTVAAALVFHTIPHRPAAHRLALGLGRQRGVARRRRVGLALLRMGLAGRRM